jgi:hypothetical protein
MEIWTNLRRYFDRSISRQPGKVWASIEDMPLLNWMKITEENDMRYMFKNIDQIDPGIDLDEAWHTVYDDYLRRFGLSKMYKRLLEVKKKKALLELDYVITRDRFNLTLIEMEESNLEAMLRNKGEGVSITTALVYLSKWLGYRLDPRDTTALEYFKIMELYGKENKQQRDSRGRSVR